MSVRSWLHPSLLANHAPPLHGMRVLAILGVVQLHLTGQLERAGVLKEMDFVRLSTAAFFGMDLFFIMSGFLIGTMLLHSMGDGKKGQVLRFYARRSFRVFPLYYVCLALFSFLYPLRPKQWESLWYEIVYLTNYHHFPDVPVMGWGWSLAVEEHFYLAVPLLILLLYKIRSDRGRIAVLALGWLSGTFVRLSIYFSHHGDWTVDSMFEKLYVKTHSRYDVLLAGVLLAYLQHAHGDALKRFFEKEPARKVFLASSLSAALWLLQMCPMSDLFLWEVFAWGTVTSLVHVPLILVVLNFPAYRSGFLASRFFLYVATLGYGIYLVHIPVGHSLVVPLIVYLTHTYSLSMWLMWPLGLVLLMAGSIFFAYLLHVLIEKPALVLRDRFAA